MANPVKPDPFSDSSEQPSMRIGGREVVDHPAHYGGADNPYEAIKVIEAWALGFCLGNAVKYICRAGAKTDEDTDEIADLKKAVWYINREIAKLEKPRG